MSLIPKLNRWIPSTTHPLAILIAALTVASALGATESGWPQFRGPNASGVGDNAKPPLHFNTSSNYLWKTSFPPGASSPCLWRDRLFLTAFSQGKLETIAVDSRDGKICWKKTAPAEKIEPFHPSDGSPASATPATDGERLYVYFGSFGLLAYDYDGKELWQFPLPIPVQVGDFGSGCSPIVSDGLVFLNRDQLFGAYLLAVHASSGKEAWRAERPVFKSSFGTPVIWSHPEGKEVVLAGIHQLKGYELKTGAEKWTVRGLPAGVCTTPVVGDGYLYFAGWSPSGNEFPLPSFDSYLEKLDGNKDSVISLSEADDQLKSMFNVFDQNRDGRLLRDEYQEFRNAMARGKNTLIAVRPGGAGDITESHVVWRETRGLPYVASPLFYRGRIYVVKDGGMVSCFDAKTGKDYYLQERLGAQGSYYASPIAADGHVYFCSIQGVVTVIGTGDSLEVLARSDLGERITATPAIAGQRIYLRTDANLYAFGQ